MEETELEKEERNDDLYDRMVDEELANNGGNRYNW